MANEDKYPSPPRELVKAQIGAQLHHAKLATEFQTMKELIDAKLNALYDQPDPDAGEVAKLKRLQHTCQLELDKMRWSGLEAAK